MKLDHFWAAIDQLAETEADKARALGISERAFRLWKNRQLPRPIRILAAHPELVQALAQDAQTHAHAAVKSS